MPEYYEGDEFAKRQAVAIEKALDYFLASSNWSSEVITLHAALVGKPDGTATFSMGNTPLVDFGRVEMNILIADNKVVITYSQDITAVYE